ncbi:MAG: SHOCT domain-containing protein [Opitutae bacterium]|jgi:hypothetical protein|nr:SHOCT domain-containing protein [Opitutae bacterium]
MIGIFFVLIIIFSIASGIANSKKAKQSEQAISLRKDFKSDLHYVSPHNQKGIAIDNTNNKILFSDQGRHTILPFMNLIATELLEDGTSISRTNRGSQLVGAAVGGALLGGVGAVIGGLSGSSTTSDRVYTVTLRVVTDDFHQPNFDIVMLDFSGSNGVEKNGILYKQAMEMASAWHSRLITILKRLSEEDVAHKPSVLEHSKNSVADEIQKLSALLDKGLLTEEEFMAQKAKLLGN